MDSAEWKAKKAAETNPESPEAKASQEAEAKVKADAEVKAKEESEAKAKEEAEAKEKAEVKAEAEKQPDDSKKDEEPEGPYVGDDKYKTEREQRKVAELLIEENKAIIKKLTEDLSNAKSQIPASEKQRILNERLGEYAKKHQADPDAVKELIGMISEAFGPNQEAVEAFNNWQKEQKAHKEQSEKVTARTKTLESEFGQKAFGDFLNSVGVTEPAKVKELQKELVAEALTLPEGLPLKRIYLSSDLRQKYESTTQKKTDVKETSHGGTQHQKVDTEKKPNEMTSQEWEEHKRAQGTGHGWEIRRQVDGRTVKIAR